MVASPEVMAGMLVCVLLAVALSAQQLAGSPLCGIVSLDTLKETQSFVRVTAWREEPIEQELQRTRAMLRDSLQNALLAAASTAAATGGPARGRSIGELQLLIGIGRPRNGLAPVGGSWLLLLALGSPIRLAMDHKILGWHFRGPLSLIAADSVVEGAQTGRLAPHRRFSWLPPEDLSLRKRPSIERAGSVEPAG